MRRNLFLLVESGSRRCRDCRGVQTVLRQMIRTCCFLHGPMCRDFGVGVGLGRKAVEYQGVHHAGHLAEAVRWRGAAVRTQSMEIVN